MEMQAQEIKVARIFSTTNAAQRSFRRDLDRAKVVFNSAEMLYSTLQVIHQNRGNHCRHDPQTTIGVISKKLFNQTAQSRALVASKLSVSCRRLLVSSERPQTSS